MYPSGTQQHFEISLHATYTGQEETSFLSFATGFGENYYIGSGVNILTTHRSSTLTRVYPYLYILPQFRNSSNITLPELSTGIPYPSTINVAGLSGYVQNVTVTLYGFTHTYPADLQMLLVSPDNEKVMFLCRAGRGADINNITLTIADSGTSFWTGEQGGTFKPTVNLVYEDSPEINLPMTSPAPNIPYFYDLVEFRNNNTSGTWSLYIEDTWNQDTGYVFSGWGLNIETRLDQLGIKERLKYTSGVSEITNLIVTGRYISGVAFISNNSYSGNISSYYRCDETGTSITVLPDSIHNNDAVINSSVASSVSGIINSGVNVPIGRYFTVSDIDFDMDCWAIRMWFKVPSIMSSNPVYFLYTNVMVTDTEGHYGCLAWEGTNGTLSFAVYSTGTVSLNNWNRLWMWKSGGLFGMKLNNENSVYDDTSEWGAPVPFGESVRLGSASSSVIKVDEIGIWTFYNPSEADMTYDWNGGTGRSQP